MSVLFLAAASLVTLYGNKEIFYRQLIWYFIGLIAIFIVSQIDWRSFLNYSWAIFGLYGLAIILLIVTYFVAPTIRGIKGWLVFGPLQFQTSEFAKLALIVVLSAFCSLQFAESRLSPPTSAKFSAESPSVPVATASRDSALGDHITGSDSTALDSWPLKICV